MADTDRDTQHIGRLIDDRLTKRGLKASDVAGKLEIHETTFSNIRNGRRRVSRKMAESIARALSPDGDERDINEFLMASGFAPQTLSERRPVVIELLNVDVLLKTEAGMQPGQQVWVFSRGLIETIQKNFFTVVCANIRKGVEYTYFIHSENVLHWGMFKKQLRENGISDDQDLLKGFVVPDEYFRSYDPNLFECIYGAENKDSFRAFRTSREIKNEYLYREENEQEAIEIREYLEKVKEADPDGKIPPCSIENYLIDIYGLPVAEKLLMKT